MQVINVVPHGYCQGVVRAIAIARQTISAYPDQPVYMLGMIVHNAYVVKACEKLGIQFIEAPGKTREQLLNQISHGVVIFTAHGVSDAVRFKAEQKGLTVVDATCPDVTRTHTLVKEHRGDVLYIGKKGHPEAEGTVSLSDRIHLITRREDLDSLDTLENVLITTQTTLSLYDVKDIIKYCLEKYPDAEVAGEICNATRMRQEAVMKTKADVLIVVGDSRSNNSAQLKHTALLSGIPQAYLIDSINMLDEAMIAGKEIVAVTSGSSTPNELTDQVLRCIRHYAETGVFEKEKEISELSL